MIGLAVVFAAMNVSLYTAIDRVGLGLAVTLEFLGPLSVALVGARTATSAGPRRTLTTICALLAGAGVVVLTRPQPTTDYVGVGFGLLAAVCWAGYILLNRTLGQRVPGVEGSAAAGALSALVYVPVGIAILIAHPPTPAALACALAAGVLSSVVPFLADLLALRRVPAHSFGIFMSLSPVFAAAIGAAFLGEALGRGRLAGDRADRQHERRRRGRHPESHRLAGRGRTRRGGGCSPAELTQDRYVALRSVVDGERVSSWVTTRRPSAYSQPESMSRRDVAPGAAPVRRWCRSAAERARQPTCDARVTAPPNRSSIRAARQ